jgi:hypothetical protein
VSGGNIKVYSRLICWPALFSQGATNLTPQKQERIALT